ncbi:NADH dehydrogenase, partial [Bacillus thuringiensis]|nr:NADH dehydrogenase [Bacillus thuringiensis]
MTIKKNNVLYHIVSKDEDSDKPYLVQYQEENGVLKVIKVDEYQEKLSKELEIPIFHFLEAKEMKQ